MVKKEIVCFLVVAFLGLASAEIVVHNLSLKENYYFGEVFSGKINLTLKNISSESNVTSNFGHRISLIDFLNKSNINYKCSNNLCEKHLSFYSGTQSKSFGIDRISEGVVGLVLFGEDINVEKINFNLSSDFSSERSVPLKINFFNKYLWEFKEDSEVFERTFTTGCYTNGSEKVSLSNTRFCQKMEIPEAKAFSIGANVLGSEPRILNMSLFDDFFNLLERCSFNSFFNDSCIVRAKEGGVFEKGNYFVCIETKEITGLSLLSGKEPKCGWASSVDDFTQKTPTHNFLIFARTALYKSSEELNFKTEELNLSKFANSFLEDNYKKNCKQGCILPIYFNGISQTIYLSNPDIKYRSQGILQSSNTFYNLKEIPYNISFSGVLNLEKLEFKSNKDGLKKLVIRIDNEKIVDEYVNVSPDYIEIISLHPSVVPAKISSLLYISVDSKSNITSYKWNFGNVTKETTSPIIYWTFNEIKNYNVSVTAVNKQGLSVSKSFAIKAVSPENYIKDFLDEKKSKAISLATGISKFPLWLQEILKKKINLNEIETTLKEIDKEINKTGLKEEDFLKIADKLQSLNIPNLRQGNSLASPLIFDLEGIYPRAVSEYSGDAIEHEIEKYKNSIWNWQTDEITGDLFYREVLKIDENKDRNLIGRHYKINIKSNFGDESYFFIDKKASELFFKEAVKAREVGGFSVVPIRAVSNNEIEFFVESKEEINFFISPRLNLLTIDREVDPICNFNSICEPERGENWENCRSDCKPSSRALIYGIIIFLFMVGIYTLLQIWYKRNYEKYLFGEDRSQIYNLLMFVANARAREISDREITNTLKKQGWNSEKIKYIMKKSYGKNVGMIEIIPISKISTILRNRKAKQNI